MSEVSKGWKLIDVVKVHGKGRIVIPQDVRKEMDVKDGDKVAVYRDFTGRFFFSKIESSTKGPRYPGGR
ncbi:hypothetical protein CH330_01400 [candidate division WOR-3 bacterium JGI_Cruoil_03_51_56]|uniref:SpoVT-AbrB domain-containing protein n=1 Tax=candidate division WOR-3 bacterium JGI_Cruoil_03_51_56 TaxID=1973747 RepID=A0A235BXJ8_UNCW3|nr:MAG: hypothetical protein CH330_01400 [candidate division WOR-3 bacterium JGI_Cruoil_03_51_56]